MPAGAGAGAELEGEGEGEGADTGVLEGFDEGEREGGEAALDSGDRPHLELHSSMQVLDTQILGWRERWDDVGGSNGFLFFFV